MAQVIVPDYQLSLAIGKVGQNARLAAKLTGYKIDIKSETQAHELGLLEELGYENEEEEYIGYEEFDGEEEADGDEDSYEELELEAESSEEAKAEDSEEIEAEDNSEETEVESREEIEV